MPYRKYMIGIAALLCVFLATCLILQDFTAQIERNRVKHMNPHELIRGGVKSLVIYAFKETGLNPNELDCNGETVLFQAIRRGDLEIIAAVVDAGVDIEVKNKEGLSVKDVANSKANAESILEILSNQKNMPK